MVKFQFSKQKTKSAEKISQQVFYIMIGPGGDVFDSRLRGCVEIQAG